MRAEVTPAEIAVARVLWRQYGSQLLNDFLDAKLDSRSVLNDHEAGRRVGKDGLRGDLQFIEIVQDNKSGIALEHPA